MKNKKKWIKPRKKQKSLRKNNESIEESEKSTQKLSELESQKLDSIQAQLAKFQKQAEKPLPTQRNEARNGRKMTTQIPPLKICFNKAETAGRFFVIFSNLRSAEKEGKILAAQTRLEKRLQRT